MSDKSESKQSLLSHGDGNLIISPKLKVFGRRNDFGVDVKGPYPHFLVVICSMVRGKCVV